MANQVKTTFTADTKPQDRAVAKLQADLARYQAQRERDEQALTRATERHAEARYRVQVRAQQRATQDILREMRRIETEQQQIAQRNAGYRQTAAGIIVGGAVGAGYLAQVAIDKAIEQARANRLLASAATEAGIAQSKLAEANQRFAASVGLSNVAAASTTSYIARLATYAGRPQDLDRLLRSFADLGAARGIGGRDLETLIGTILSGQDEGLNRLGISDPGQLQRAYAASIGKTVEQLTQQEKVQAAVNAVMEKAAIFTGAAEARMNSLEGQVARSTAAWENFTTALSTTLTTSGPVTEFLNEAGRLMKSLSLDVETVNRKLAEGKTARQIAQEEYSGATFGDRLSAFAVGGYGLPGVLGSTGLFGEGYRIASNPQLIYKRRFEEYVAQIEAQKRANQQQEQAAKDEALKAYFNRAPAYTAQIDTIREQRDRSLQTDVRAVEAAAEKAKRDADDLKRKMEELRRARIAAFDALATGTDNPFLNFLGNANRQMRTLLESARDLSPAIRDALIQSQKGQNAENLLGLRLDTRLDAYSLRLQAQEFRQGYRNDLSDPRTVQRILDDQRSILGRQFNPISDARLINIAQNLDPKLLRPDQRRDIASAFERESARRERFESAGLDFYQSFQRLISDGGLKVKLIEGEHLVRIVNEATDRARVSSRPTATDVSNRVGN